MKWLQEFLDWLLDLFPKPISFIQKFLPDAVSKFSVSRFFDRFTRGPK
jgi:hypothetical protein